MTTEMKNAQGTSEPLSKEEQAQPEERYCPFRELETLEDVIFVLNSSQLAMGTSNPHFSEAVDRGLLMGVSHAD